MNFVKIKTLNGEKMPGRMMAHFVFRMPSLLDSRNMGTSVRMPGIIISASTRM